MDNQILIGHFLTNKMTDDSELTKVSKRWKYISPIPYLFCSPLGPAAFEQNLRLARRTYYIVQNSNKIAKLSKPRGNQ